MHQTSSRIKAATYLETGLLHSTLIPDFKIRMDAIIISPGELSRAYRDSIKTVPNNIVKRTTVDDTLVNECCLICSEDFLPDTEVVTLRCSCRYWAHERCLGQSIFTTDRCPICRIDTLLLDDEYVLASAARGGNLDQVQQLLDLGTGHSPGASTSAKDRGKRTPLHVATETGVSETVRILINKGADVSSVDEQGRTPLHCAVQLDYAAVTKSLLDGGADVSVMDHTGRAARDIAREGEFDRIQRVLDGEEVELRTFFRGQFIEI
ncbi:ankyrin repeat-containing domain protein [Aspergillus varians]